MTVQFDLIAQDPTDGCALPKTEHREMQTLSADQLAAFLLEAKHSGVFEMYYIELATGLRRGELLGLKWEDIDFTAQTLRVRRQVGRINGEVREAPLKTKNAYRTISLGTDAVGVLKQQREKQPSSSPAAAMYFLALPAGRLPRTACSICSIGCWIERACRRFASTIFGML